MKDKELEYMPGIDLPIEEMNADLHVLAPSDLNTYHMGDFLLLLLYNTSDYPIVLPADFGVHIFQFVDGEWEVINDRMEESLGQKCVLANGDENHGSEIVGIFPDAF